MLENRIPPPLVAVVFAIGMWAASPVLPSLAVASWLSTALAVGVLVIGAATALAGTASFRKFKTTVNPLQPEKASTLVTTGVYRVTRNPMYLGMALVLLAWAFYLKSPVTLLGIPGFAAYMNRFQIRPEERALAQRFGESFETYCREVRRWF